MESMIVSMIKFYSAAKDLELIKLELGVVIDGVDLSR